MGALQGLARKGDLLLMDKLCHTSLKSGAKLSGAKFVNFKHNDFKDAEKQIKANKYKKLIMVIEGVYSMDGDIGNLKAARELCDKYGAILILDEAHSLGTIGKTGRGTEEYYEYKYRADIICGSFTKSIASVGGYIATTKDYREFYTFHAVGAVFSAPLSAYHAGAAYKALEIIEKTPEMIQKLHDNAVYFRKKFKDNGFNIGETITCVIPVIFKDMIQAMKLHRYMLVQGFFSSLVMAPACPIDAPRFRVTAIASYTKNDMDEIVDIFIKARENVKETEKFTRLMDLQNN